MLLLEIVRVAVSGTTTLHPQSCPTPSSLPPARGAAIVVTTEENRALPSLLPTAGRSISVACSTKQPSATE